MKKHVFKRLLSMLLVAMLTISLAACSSSPDNELTSATDVQSNGNETGEDDSNGNESEMSEIVSESEAESEVVKATESGNVLKEKKGLGEEDYTGKQTMVRIGSTVLTRSLVTSITFLDSLSDMPEEADGVIVGDVSAMDDGSVMAWAIRNEDGATYSLYFAGEGGVDAGEDCTKLFADFTNVVSIEFNGYFYTGNAISMEEMFSGNTALQTLDLSCFDTTNVTDMSSMFYNCEAMLNLNMDGWSTSNVTSMFCMFYYCESLIELNISDWDTSTVEDMQAMFFRCISLEELSIGNWDVSKVGSMTNMFSHCTSLTSLDISDWDTSNVANMRSMFDFCTSLTSMDINGWDVTNCVEMTDMFRKCNDEVIPDWYVND